MRFSLYGPGMRSISLKKMIAMQAYARKSGNYLLAMAENSGCEGCYCEVAAWNDEAQTWQRFAFNKFFDSEMPVNGDDDASAWDIAKHIADQINDACCSSAPDLIHSMDDFTGVIEPVPESDDETAAS